MDDRVEIFKQLNCLKKIQSLAKTCSCSECNSSFCFIKSRLAVPCSCDDCTKLIICQSNSKHSGAMKDNYSELINSVYLNKSIYPRSYNTELEESFKSDINFELERKRVIEANMQNRLITQRSKTNIEILTHNARTENQQFTSNTDNTKVTEVKYEKPLEPVNSNITLLVNKLFAKLSEACFCKMKCSCKKNKNKNSEFENDTQIQSLILSPDFKNLNSRAADLTTEVMDLPCKISSASGISKTSETSNKNFKYDFLKRLEEVYKACSCKVCECIPTKVLNHEICNCKPCECLDCKRYKTKLEGNRVSKQLLYTPGQYNDQNENNYPNKWIGDCFSKICNYVQNNDINKYCDCKPCQCNNCKQIVPQMQVLFAETQQNSPCQCLPCNCTDCLGAYTDTTKDLVHEVSTTTSRQSDCRCEICAEDSCKEGFESCRCYNKNIMKKPFEIAIHDYDIRATTVNNEVYHYATEGNEGENEKMIDMLSSVRQLVTMKQSSRLYSYDKITNT